VLPQSAEEQYFVNRLTRAGITPLRARHHVGLTTALTLLSLTAPTAAFAADPGNAASTPRSSTSGFVIHDPDPEVFGEDGKVGVHGTSISDDFLGGLALAPDGKILASGFAIENTPDGLPQSVTVTRRNRDGSPDRTFGENGVVLLKELSGQAVHIKPTADGGVIGSGFENTDGPPNAVVFRLDAHGRLVSGFGDGGIVHFPSSGPGVGFRLAIQPDGKVVLAGLSSPADDTDISVRRLLPNGAFDPGFGVDGETTVDLPGDDQASSVALQADGKIVIVGQTAQNNDAVAVRFTTDGSLDKAFGDDGIASLNAKGIENGAGIALQTDGKVVVVGGTRATLSDPKDAVIFRLLRNGHLDTSFNSNGRIIFTNPGNDSGNGISIARDMSIVITSFQAQQVDTVTDSFLNRVTSAGKPDLTFGTSGAVTVHNPEATFELGLEIQPDGKIVTAGRRGGFGVVDSIGTINRYNSDGSFDSTK
jgi:uncharacterized delta-60 repeat protein